MEDAGRANALVEELFDRLVADDASDDLVDTVLAAAAGDDELQRLAGGTPPSRPAERLAAPFPRWPTAHTSRTYVYIASAVSGQRPCSPSHLAPV